MCFGIALSKIQFLNYFMYMHKKISLNGCKLTLKDSVSIAYGAQVEIDGKAKKRVKESRNFVKKISEKKRPVYGINTGFGFFANKLIDAKSLKNLQHNLIVSHAVGTGPSLSIPETRLVMALRLNVLVKGLTGVRFEVCALLKNLINSEIYPLIPEYGSVGASGDLAPLAHLALTLIGLGNVSYRGKVTDA